MESHFPTVADDRRAARARVADDLRNLAADTEQLLRATAQDASQAASEARARVEAALIRAKATCAQLTERGLEQAAGAARRVDDVVRTRPYESLAVALGIGVLLGALLSRRR